MADQPEVRLLGFDELARGSTKLADNIEDAARKALGATAEHSAAAARMRVPRVSGRLASTVFATTADVAAVGMGDSGTPYAGWIEFGGTRGRPYVGGGRYLYPPALAAEPQVIAAALAAANSEIERMRWPTPNQT